MDPRPSDRALLLKQLTDSEAWQIIDKWLQLQDDDVTKQVKQFISLFPTKHDAEIKKLAYLSGRASVIAHLRGYIKEELASSETKKTPVKSVNKYFE